MANLEEIERSIMNIEKKVMDIEERNRKVEADKSWETSYTRRLLLIFFTYVSIGFYLSVINVPNPCLSSIVPAFAFFLSTLTLPFFKNMWFRYKK